MLDSTVACAKPRCPVHCNLERQNPVNLSEDTCLISCSSYLLLFIVSSRAIVICAVALQPTPFSNLRSALDELQGCRRLPCRAAMRLKSALLHLGCRSRRKQAEALLATQIKTLTVSGESSGWTLAPSKRNRTVFISLPCLAQKASMSFLSCVDLLILKKTSLLPSVTLIFKCSVG